MKSVLLAAILGGVAMFAWGAISWMVLHLHDDTFQGLDNEAAVAEVLKQGNLEAGAYGIPYYDMAKGDEAEEKAWTERHKAGPLAFLIYDPEGSEPMPPMTFVKGGVLNIAMAFVAALMLSAAGIGSFFGRFFFVVGFGVLAGLGEGMYWNWMRFPDKWTTVQATDHLASWALAGIVLAMIVKPKP